MPLDEFLATAELSDPAVALLEALAHERKLRTLGDLVDFARLQEGAALQRRAGAVLAAELGRSLRRYLAEKTPESSPARSLVLEKYARRPGAREGTPEPPLDYLQTVAWAAERGVPEALSFRALEVLDPSLVTQLGPLDPTIEELLRDPGSATGALSARLPPQLFDRLRAASVAWLHAYAIAEREARAGDRRAAGGLPRTPELPSLRALAERLSDARRGLRAVYAPVPLRTVRGSALRFLERPPHFSYELRLASEAAPNVTLELALQGWESRTPAPACSCPAGSRGCPHAITALDAVLEWLYSLRGAAAARVDAVLAAPEWKRLQALAQEAADGIISALQRTPELTGRLRAGAAPLLELWSAEGNGPPRRLEPADLLALPVQRALPHASRLGALLRAGLTFEALSLLGPVPLVDADDPSRALTLLRAEPELAVELDPDASVRFSLRVAGEPDSAPLLSGRSLEAGPLVLHDRARSRCLLLEIPPELVTLAPLLAGGVRFPFESVPPVLERLEALAPRVRIELPERLRGERVRADDRVVLQLAPMLPAGLRGEVRLRPLNEGPALVPGAGPLRVSASRNGRRIFVERDLAAERARTAALLAELGLTAQPDFTFSIPEEEAALDLLLATREHAGELAVEWSREALAVSVTRAAAATDLRVAVSDGPDWFGVSGELEVEGTRVDLKKVLESVAAGRRYVRLSTKQWLALSNELVEKLQPAAEVAEPTDGELRVREAAAVSLVELVRAAGEADLSARSRRTLERLRPPDEEPAIPLGLNASLRPYQVEGFRWMSRMAGWGLGACLADDMGLGKTVQTLAMLLERGDQGPALVVAPTSVGFNWVREARRFAPELNAFLYRDSDRDRVLRHLGPQDVVVASYGLVVRDLERLSRVRFSTLVLDEAQAVKNLTTQRTQAVRALDAGWKLALTGTPVENHLGELYSLFDILAPGLLGTREAFRERFAVPIQRDHDAHRRGALASLVRPYVLRRTKTEVAPELPARTEVLVPVTLSTEERALYEAVRRDALEQLSGARAGERFQVLAAITRLRQLSCHPRLFDPASTLGSAKLERLTQLVQDLRAGGHRALIFSQFTSHLALVREALDARGVRYLYLDGQTPEPERRRRVDAFQEGDGDLFLISLKAGGTGLNLTAADYVLHLDPWWNPAVEDQATDRAHRIGQTKPVTVYRLVASATIEEAILALHESKRDLVAGVLEGADVSGALSAEELLDVIRRGGEPVG